MEDLEKARDELLGNIEVIERDRAHLTAEYMVQKAGVETRLKVTAANVREETRDRIAEGKYLLHLRQQLHNTRQASTVESIQMRHELGTLRSRRDSQSGLDVDWHEFYLDVIASVVCGRTASHHPTPKDLRKG